MSQETLAKARAILRKFEENTMPSNPAQSQALVPPEKQPDIQAAQAKLKELESYLNAMGLKSVKWMSYLDEARKQAAVGDSSFDSVPKLDQDDMQYMRERDRKKMRQQYQGGM